MASNARQLNQTVVNYQQVNYQQISPVVNSRPKLDPDGYQRAAFTKRERSMTRKFVVVSLSLLLGVAAVSNIVTNLNRELSQVQTKANKLKTENNKITQEINQATTLNHLEKVADNSQMNRSNGKIKNIN